MPTEKTTSERACAADAAARVPIAMAAARSGLAEIRRFIEGSLVGMPAWCDRRHEPKLNGLQVFNSIPGSVVRHRHALSGGFAALYVLPNIFARPTPTPSGQRAASNGR